MTRQLSVRLTTALLSEAYRSVRHGLANGLCTAAQPAPGRP